LVQPIIVFNLLKQFYIHVYIYIIYVKIYI
jgi:hypothetical protein